MQIEFIGEPQAEQGTRLVLVGADGALSPSAAVFDGRTGGAVGRALRLAGARLERRGTLIWLTCPGGTDLDHLGLLSLGKPDGLAAHDLERAGGTLATQLAERDVKVATIATDLPPGYPLEPATVAFGLATGAVLRSYRFDKYRTEPGDERDGALERLALVVDAPEALNAEFEPVRGVLHGVARGRDLVSEPANVLSPGRFAELCQTIGGEVGLEVEILDKPDLEALGMRALLAVAQGSAEEPHVAVLRWSGGEGGAPVALVGKGVCFDSGGLSLKPAGSMEDMKWDMGGAGAVFGAMLALAGRKAKVDVVGVLGLVENMPSGTAQRPGDVIKAMSGLTVEVLNTDAEGRLLLADVLHYTADRFRPKVMVDLATLTGAVIVALGGERAGVFSDDDTLADALAAAGDAVGEKLWRLPLGEEYAEHIKSEIADIKNVGKAREAGATAGAVFLQRFVGEVPWAHIDIAGVTWSKRDLPLSPKGATGFGIRLLDRWIHDQYER